jgi:adenosylcobyric acid synthase
MIQGTGSDVGKSFITAGLCRHFADRGIRVAPFKAQNMALNSYVTRDGKEMGRAQVYQAEACKIEPRAEMNPILLKPAGDNNSQVIVLGEPLGHFEAKEYYANREKYFQVVRDSFETLKQEFDLIVIEGAGSPAEINLKHLDIVNMRVAREFGSPVLLVGDIDRGGVFAWLKGTLDLLDPSDRERVKGVIVNRFRGDVSLLIPGLQMFEGLTSLPVLGVLPYDLDLHIDEEDGIQREKIGRPRTGSLKIGIVRLPRISNFTDFDPLFFEEDVQAEYVLRPEDMRELDLVILPGTKNVMDDMQFLWDRGFAEALSKRDPNRTALLGICGGFQMMGIRILDPHHVESRRDESKGLGCFRMKTVLELQKTKQQVELQTLPTPHLPPAGKVKGYEIHMGRTELNEPVRHFLPDPNGPVGIVSESGDAIGTYVHGILDNDAFRLGLLNHLRRRKGLPERARVLDYREFRNRQFERLSRLVAGNLNLDLLERIIFS